MVVPAARSGAADPPAEKVVYDFEDAAGIKAWSNLVLPAAGDKEPPVKIEQSADHATAGKHSLKLTFAGGRWPTVATEGVSQDWLAYKTFKADVTVGRPCVVGFTLLQEKSQRGDGWEAVISRWTKTAFLKPGKNEVVASLLSPNDYAVHPKWGKVVRFEVFMYNPHDGETIHVDNIRLCNDKPAAPRAGPDGHPGDGLDPCRAGRSDGCRRARPEPRPGLEPARRRHGSIRSRRSSGRQYAELKKKHPRAVLAVLRDGEKGYDPANPDKVYAGWKDAYWSAATGPNGVRGAGREPRPGRRRTRSSCATAARSCAWTWRASPPARTILAARLVVVQTSDKVLDDHDPAKRPTMWVVEPCNRPWDEYEVNAFQYAKDKFWKDVGGCHSAATTPTSCRSSWRTARAGREGERVGLHPGRAVLDRRQARQPRLHAARRRRATT